MFEHGNRQPCLDPIDVAHINLSCISCSRILMSSVLYTLSQGTPCEPQTFTLSLLYNTYDAMWIRFLSKNLSASMSVSKSIQEYGWNGFVSDQSIHQRQSHVRVQFYQHTVGCRGVCILLCWFISQCHMTRKTSKLRMEKVNRRRLLGERVTWSWNEMYCNPRLHYIAAPQETVARDRDWQGSGQGYTPDNP